MSRPRIRALPRIAAAVVFAAAAVFLAAAVSVAAEPPPAAPTEVFVGMYVNSVHGMSLKDAKYDVDFFIWFRWKGEERKPLETFGLTNGTITFKDEPYETVRGEYRYVVCRCQATIVQYWDVRTFPFDDHTLEISVEDGIWDTKYQVYTADGANTGANSGLSPKVDIPGWKMLGFEAASAEYTYRTNYGDPALKPRSPTTYSRFIYKVRVARPGYAYFAKLFIGLFIAIALAFLALFIKPTNLDARFGLGVGAIFAAVAMQFVVGSYLPATAAVTLADRLLMLAFGVILLTLVQSTASLALFENERESASRKLDKICLGVGIPLYLGVSAALVALR